MYIYIKRKYYSFLSLSPFLPYPTLRYPTRPYLP